MQEKDHIGFACFSIPLWQTFSQVSYNKRYTQFYVFQIKPMKILIKSMTFSETMITAIYHKTKPCDWLISVNYFSHIFTAIYFDISIKRKVQTNNVDEKFNHIIYL